VSKVTKKLDSKCSLLTHCKVGKVLQQTSANWASHRQMHPLKCCRCWSPQRKPLIMIHSVIG